MKSFMRELLLDQYEELAAADAVGAAQILRRARAGEQIFHDSEAFARLFRTAFRLVDRSEVKMAEDEIRIDIGRFLERRQRVREPPFLDPEQRHEVMRPEIQRVERERAAEPVRRVR